MSTYHWYQLYINHPADITSVTSIRATNLTHAINVFNTCNGPKCVDISRTKKYHLKLLLLSEAS